MARTAQLQTQQNNEVQTFEKRHAQKLIAETQQMVANGRLDLPADYSPGNAITSAWLRLQNVQDRNHRPALEVCTAASIANSIRDMVAMGLNPAKEQCWFIVYGDQLTMRPSYFGYMMMAKRVQPSIADITAQVVYQGDLIETDMMAGKQCVTKHKTDPFAKHPIADAIGAYCNIIYKDGHWESTIMTIDEVHASWEVGGAQLGSKAHKLTPQDMIKRTVISKACRCIIRQSSDRTLFTDAVHRNELTSSLAERDEKVENHTNVIDVDFEHSVPASTERVVVETEVVEEQPQAGQEPETVAPAAEETQEVITPTEAELGTFDEETGEYIPF